MTITNIDKQTSAQYGEKYQLAQAEKYRNRDNNHWKFRIGLAHTLVTKYALPRLHGKQFKDIIVVDVGCSIGTFALEFAKLGFRSYGIDFDHEALKIARRLREEERVDVQFILGDISEWNLQASPIDIALCFDIFEHLQDDELGSFLQSIRKQLSSQGSLVFHTFPTQYDYIFFRKTLRRFPMVLFKDLPAQKFNNFVKAYAALIDVGLALGKGHSYKDRIRGEHHCNPTTKERLFDILRRAGFKILYLESANLYPFEKSIQELFSKQPICHRNLYGVVIPN